MIGSPCATRARSTRLNVFGVGRSPRSGQAYCSSQEFSRPLRVSFGPAGGIIEWGYVWIGTATIRFPRCRVRGTLRERHQGSEDGCAGVQIPWSPLLPRTAIVSCIRRHHKVGRYWSSHRHPCPRCSPKGASANTPAGLLPRPLNWRRLSGDDLHPFVSGFPTGISLLGYRSGEVYTLSGGILPAFTRPGSSHPARFLR